MRPPARQCLEVTSGASRFFALASHKCTKFPTPCRSITASPALAIDSRAFTSQAREIVKQAASSTYTCDHPAPGTASRDRHSAVHSPLRRTTRTSRNVNLRSGFTYTTGVVVLLAIVAISCAATVDLREQTAATNTTTTADSENTLAIASLAGSMSTQIAPGHVGNLTPEQEEKLRQLWHALFQVCGVSEDNSSAGADAASRGKPEAAEADGQKKKRFGVFKRKGNDKSPAPSEAEDDKYGQNKHFQEVLANHSPEVIRETYWTMVKHDHPDALALRFLRARKWDVEKALVMLVSTMSWRHTEMKVDADIMKNGEEGAVLDAQNGKGDAKKVGEDFLAQLRMGKSFLHGVDKQGRPICVVRVRLHRQGEQCEESLERCTVFLIETARMVLRPPVDTATVVFDMTGFSMANMDYTPVKFMIKCFEANYPESLGAVLVHNAPWLFQGIWKIIRGWLDPVVAAKVHFTNNKNDLQEFIEPEHILKELGGDEDWEYKYEEPVIGENDVMKDTETRGKLVGIREKLMKEYEEATVQWIHKGDSKEITDKRDQLATQLRENYWQLDPYVRARSLYDRQRILQETSADDVD
ncbi:CRAL-TRIO domain-containing protein C3H8.02 [Trichoderma asperellum]|uniref:CRAL-TRIO domain-containing protein C3H8.02 n=1 Tax=Trichoderma asperellum TaxID=101201 RepID=A0A6V8QS30_TRIAP|nr:CRAL-TRIO domain-containing protein C3H8.02 [Trichoderma asperellum]